MEGKEQENIKGLEKEMHKVTGLLDFLIEQPQLLTILADVDKERIMIRNLLRVKCCKLWADSMIKKVEKGCSKENIKGMDILFKMIEVKDGKE